MLLQRMLCNVVADRFELFEVLDHAFLKEGKFETQSLAKLKQSSWREFFDQDGKFRLSKTEMIHSLPTEVKGWQQFDLYFP